MDDVAEGMEIEGVEEAGQAMDVPELVAYLKSHGKMVPVRVRLLRILPASRLFPPPSHPLTSLPTLQ